MPPLEGSFGRTPKVDPLPDKVEGFICTQSCGPDNSESNRSGRIVDGCNASSADSKRIIEHNEEDPFKRPILHDVEQSPASTMTMDNFPLVTGVSPVPISLSISQSEKDIDQTTASPGTIGKHQNPFAHLNRLQLESKWSTTNDNFEFQFADDSPPFAQFPVSCKVENNPFSFSPGQLNQMYNPTNLIAFYYRGGIQRIANGPKTDLRFGLSDGCVNIQSPVSLHEAVGKVKRNPGQGFTDLDDFECRQRVLGENRLLPPKEKPLLKVTWITPSDKVLIPLAVAAAISFGIASGLLKTCTAGTGGQWDGYVAIMVAVLVVMAIGALDDTAKECQFRELSRKKNDREVKVVRSGKHTLILVCDIVVGDVLTLEPGDLVPVDGIFIDGYDVKCDESSATGESDLVRKTSGKIMNSHDGDTGMTYLDPFIISGSRVIEGVGTVLVTAVGEHSSIGQNMMLLRNGEDTNMGVLDWFMRLTGYLGDFLCATLILGPSLLYEVLAMVVHFFWELIVLMLNTYRSYSTELLSGAFIRADARRSRFNRSRGSCARKDLDGSHHARCSLRKTLPNVHWDEAGLGSHALPLATELDSLTSMMIPPVGTSSTAPGQELFRCCYVMPLVAAALTVSRGLRIASGATSAISGVSVIPLRTAEGFPVWSLALTYSIWATASLAYLWLQTRRIRPEVKHRRQLYIFCVIMAAAHFTVAISQGSTSIPDAFTLYSPILLTASAYLMSLLLKAVFPQGFSTTTSVDGASSPALIDGNVAAGGGSNAQPDPVALSWVSAAMGGCLPGA
ncbi:calcium-translocating P-type ATPase [Colletotrichum simmondsii]|uniref:Calcium-translocating P-type ATPase n=1 Tax=Colletotrichum simmondsii TaxID=703756 RepID=A0A135TNN8_9PEZI|nr:calcium-translocating P-type ATPase [Colletotrichum simmondsii]